MKLLNTQYLYFRECWDYDGILWPDVPDGDDDDGGCVGGCGPGAATAGPAQSKHRH